MAIAAHGGMQKLRLAKKEIAKCASSFFSLAKVKSFAVQQHMQNSLLLNNTIATAADGNG